MHIVSDGVVRLSDVDEGTVVRLHDLQLDEHSRSQLRALGLTGLSPFRVCKQGEPCLVQVRTTRIGVSASVARQIFVRVEGALETESTWR